MPKKKQATPKKSPKKQPKKSSNKILQILIGVVLLGIIGYLIYSVVVFEQSEQEKEGFFACNEDKTVCELSQHIHSDIDLTVCGEHIVFEKEKGRTDEQHTHKEKNLIHWHARLNVDPTTHEPLDPTRVQIQAFLDQMEYSLPQTCPDNPNPTLTVLINEKPSDMGLDYVWKDGDTITITYN